MDLTDYFVFGWKIERVVIDDTFKVRARSQPSTSHEDYVSEWLVEFGRNIEQVAYGISRIIHFFENGYVSGEHICGDYPAGWTEVCKVSGTV